VLSNYPGHKEQSIGGLGTLQVGIETIDMNRGWSANNRSRDKRLRQRINAIESRSHGNYHGVTGDHLDVEARDGLYFRTSLGLRH